MNDNPLDIAVIDGVSVGHHVSHSLKLELPVGPFGVFLQESLGRHSVMHTGVVLKNPDRTPAVTVDIGGKRAVFLNDLSHEEF